MLKTLPRVKLRDLVADRIKAYIIEEDLKTGDRLPTETELAEQFGVSRLSIREATKSLEFLGIVEARPRRGLIVGSVNMDRVIEHLGFHPAIHNVAPQQLIGTRIVIETGVMPYVAERMQSDPEIYLQLNSINDELRQCRTLAQWTELDIAFHRALICASGLLPLTPFTDILAVFFTQFRESVKKAEWSIGLTGHQAIIDALRENQPQQAAELMRAHIGFHKIRSEEETPAAE